MSFIKPEDFKEVSLEDGRDISRFISATQPLSCEFNFANMICWGPIYGLKWASAGKLLMLYDEKDDELAMPLSAEGKMPPLEILLELSDAFIAGGGKGSFVKVPEEYIREYPETERYFNISPLDEFSEYVHLTERLVNLSGGKLRKKRNLIRQFERNNPRWKCEAIKEENLRDCFELAKKWCLEKHCESWGFSHEKSAFSRALEYYGELGLEGLIIYTEKGIAAFAIFSRQNDEAYSVHYEKADIEEKGAAQAINHEVAKYLRDKCRYINREEDMGLPGLRKAKSSYDPDLLLKFRKLLRKN